MCILLILGSTNVKWARSVCKLFWNFPTTCFVFTIFQQHILCFQQNLLCLHLCLQCIFTKVSARQKISRMLTLKVLQPKVNFQQQQNRNRCEFKKKDTKPVVSVLVSLFHVICKFHKVLWDFLDHMFQVKILGSDEIHVKEGSGVSLRCAITNTAQVFFPFLKLFSSNQLDVKNNWGNKITFSHRPQAISYVTWSRNNQVH